MKKIIIIYICMLLISQAFSLTSQQQTFIDAEKALGENNAELFEILSKKLKNYELYPYLEYKKISQNLSDYNSQTIGKFIKSYSDTILSKDLYNKWAYLLVQNKNWDEILKLSTIDKHSCLYNLANLNKNKFFTNEINTIWNKSNLSSYYCHSLLLSSVRNKKILSENFWGKIINQKSLDKSFIKAYKKNDPAIVKTFLTYLNNPSKILDGNKISDNNFYSYLILNKIIKNIDKDNIINLAKKWPKIISKYNFNQKQLNNLYYQLSQYLFFSSKLATQDFIKKIPIKNKTEKIYRISALTAMSLNNWTDLIKIIYSMPKNQQHDSKWQYWLARAYIKTNNKIKGELILNKIADNRNYYGFLASNLLNQAPNFNYSPSIIRYQDINKIKNNLQIRRALELYALSKKQYALREWIAAINNFSDKDKILAAKLATIKGWNHAAILSLIKVSDNNDILSRFPLTYFNEINDYAKNNKLNPALIYAINRQESSFAINAISHAGAKGLMQITDSTFNVLAKELQMNDITIEDIYTPEINLKLGSYYIRKLLNRYEENIILSIAAYNAGPLSVYKWPYISDYDPDVWIEIIPYKETRNYIKNALTFATIYEYRLGEKYSILKDAVTGFPPTRE